MTILFKNVFSRIYLSYITHYIKIPNIGLRDDRAPQSGQSNLPQKYTPGHK